MQVEAAELGLESTKNVEMIFPVGWNQTSKLEHQSNCRCHSSGEHTASHTGTIVFHRLRAKERERSVAEALRSAVSEWHVGHQVTQHITFSPTLHTLLQLCLALQDSKFKIRRIRLFLDPTASNFLVEK